MAKKKRAAPPKRKTVARKKPTKKKPGHPRSKKLRTRSGPPSKRTAGQAPNLIKEGAGRGEVLKDALLIGRSIRERWGSSDESRTALRERLQDRAMKTRDDKDLAILARVVVTMEGHNQRDEETAINVQLRQIDKVIPDQIEVSHHVDLAAILEADPEYVEYQRHKQSQQDIDAGAICQISLNGNAGAVANGKAHGSSRPGTNGHCNGSK